MWNLKKDTNELIYKTERDTQAEKNKLLITKGGEDKLGEGEGSFRGV